MDSISLLPFINRIRDLSNSSKKKSVLFFDKDEVYAKSNIDIDFPTKMIYRSKKIGKRFSLVSLTRKNIRDTLRICYPQYCLFRQVHFLPIPNILKKYLLYNIFDHFQGTSEFLEFWDL